MVALDLSKLQAVPTTHEPFDHLVVPNFIRPDAWSAINADYPHIEQPGSYPVSQLRYGPAFAGMLQELRGPAFRQLMEQKFGLDLKSKPSMITARGRSGDKDGFIHTDAVTKLITVLIYMNPSWEKEGGRLRLLRSKDNINDVFLEVPPDSGTLLAFRRSDNSFHGHKPFIGERRVIQFNWVTSRWVMYRETLRHKLSAHLKRFFPSRVSMS